MTTPFVRGPFVHGPSYTPFRTRPFVPAPLPYRSRVGAGHGNRASLAQDATPTTTGEARSCVASAR